MIGANHRILVVDDNAVVLKAFELKLRADGFNVTTLTEAAGVASTAEQSKAEIIILDINFPAGGAIEWSGFTVLQWLRRFPEVARIPVILITGSELEPLKAKALASGAVEIFQKPVDYQQLLATLLRTLKAKGNPPAPDPASS